jgi:splicing factor 3B subunit 3
VISVFQPNVLGLSFLGKKPVRLLRVQIQRTPAILALSSRSWLNYAHQNHMYFTPLIYENLDYAWNFSNNLCPEGIIALAGRVLK